jgi:hypothetical protein
MWANLEYRLSFSRYIFHRPISRHCVPRAMQELVELLKQQQEHAVKMEAQLPPDLRQVPHLPCFASSCSG